MITKLVPFVQSIVRGGEGEQWMVGTWKDEKNVFENSTVRPSAPTDGRTDGWTKPLIGLRGRNWKKKRKREKRERKAREIRETEQ